MTRALFCLLVWREDGWGKGGACEDDGLEREGEAGRDVPPQKETRTKKNAECQFPPRTQKKTRIKKTHSRT